MAGRTIPEPTEAEVQVAMTGLRIQAEARGLDVMDPDLNDFLVHMSKVQGQMMAETRWLRNMTHDPAALEEFLEGRNG